MARENWTKEQTIVALSLYNKVSYNQISGTSNPKIKDTAKIIGKTPAALAFKLMNLSSLDPERNYKGKSNASKLDRELWAELYGNWEDLALQNALALAKYEHKKLDQLVIIDEPIKEGKEKERLVMVRINQYDFRERILANYNETCCITGIAFPQLLIASHIKAWAKDNENRLNPKNGICLNNLHDKAFDRGLLTITPDYKIKLSRQITDKKRTANIEQYFLQYAGKNIILPDRHLPDPLFLKFHNETIFINE